VTHALVLHAADFAARRHRHQKRKDEAGSPYINHPVRVAWLLSSVGAVDDEHVLAAALLHDTVEDTSATPADIRREFGPRVYSLVMEVSDDTTLAAPDRKRVQIESAPALSEGAVLIKLADKTANIQDIIDSPPQGWSLQRKVRYLDWAESVVDGCASVNDPLQSLFRKTLAHARDVLAAEAVAADE
jgi:guanosine-3',5'-bis(diphosphate) 3'-pyrophosphohydrolase